LVKLKFAPAENNVREDKKMLKIDKPETLIELLASYRRAPVPRSLARQRDLAGMAAAMQRNCALTVYFTGRRLRDLEQEGEEVYALLAVRKEALVLGRRCAGIGARRGRNLPEEVESLWRRYDNFTGSVRYLFHLLDRSLAGRLDGVL
jgi:hypothetical protein